jgi:hypothetical protein
MEIVLEIYAWFPLEIEWEIHASSRVLSQGQHRFFPFAFQGKNIYRSFLIIIYWSRIYDSSSLLCIKDRRYI